MVTLEIVGVFRECQECHAVKPLEHFLLLNRWGVASSSVKVCATCRRPKRGN